MATNQMLAALRHLQRDLDARCVKRFSDLDLLRRFVVRRDEAAFAALVGRHGGLVLHVCRRVLDRDADVDDAFQATFLVLARTAGSIRKRTSLASWLHGVAFRSSMNLRKSVMRRHKHERAAASLRSVETRSALARLHDLQAVLDEEIQRLAEPYRAAFVACCLESKSRAEAARALGWKEGTLASRLAKAREILQKRLVARGVTLSATLGAIGLTQSATSATSAAVPAALARGTVDAAIAFAADQATGTASGSVIALAESVLRGMLMTKLKLGALLMTIAAFGMFSLSVLVAQPVGDNVPAKPNLDPKPPLPLAQDPPKPDRPRTDVLGDPLPKGATARLGITRLRDNFTSMVASPDSRALVTTARGAIRFLEIGSGKGLDEIDTGDKTHSALAFSPDGKTFITLDQWQRFPWNAEAKLITSLVTWDASTRKPLRTAKLNDPPPLRLLFTPDGKFLLGSREATVIVIDAGTGMELRRRELGKITNPQDQWWNPDLDGFALSPNGRLAALATSTDVKLWDWRSADSTPRSMPMTRDGRCSVVAFSADGQTLVGRSNRDFGLHVWNVASGKLLKDWYGHRGLDSANNLAMHPDGKRLVTTRYGEQYSNAAEREGGAYLWNLESGLMEKSFATPIGCGRCAFSPDGRWLIAKSEGGAHVWDLETGREVAADPGAHAAGIKAIAVSTRGTIATASDDGTVGLWNEQGKLVKKLPISAESVHWSPDGTSLLCTNNADTIDLWDAATGQKRYSVPGRGYGSSRSHTHALTFVGDGSCFLSFAIEDYELREYRTATGKIVSVRSLQPKGFDPKYLKQTGGPVDSAGNTIPLMAHCEMTRDGVTLFTAEGSHLRLIDTSTGKELREFETGEQPSFYGSRMSPDGRLLLFDKHLPPLNAHDPWSYSLVWFDLDKGGMRVMPPTVNPLYWPTFSSDSKYVATTNSEHDGPRFVQIWDCATGKEVSVIPIPRGSAQSLAFSNDNRKLYTGMSDSSVLIWDLPRR
jgi:RNA polymerase sigma factor (sigma-70 family)